jgi:predicted metal-dependent hydrolase
MTSEGDAKLFLQALIQLAAACVHLSRGNAAPGARLLALADEKLARAGRDIGGIKRDLLRKGIGQAMERVGRGDAPGDVAKSIRL